MLDKQLYGYFSVGTSESARKDFHNTLYRVSQKKVSLVDCWSYQSFVTFKKVSLTHSISSDGLENFFIYPTWVKENCKKFSGQNTVWNMVKIHFEKYQNSKKSKISRFVIAKLMLIKNH